MLQVLPVNRPAGPFVMRFLCLAHDEDATARRVAARLGARHGAGAVALVTMWDLALADEFTHCLPGDKSHTTIRLRDGRVIDSDDIAVVFNRLRQVSVPQFARAAQADRDYATMEVFALIVSWLTSLGCPVVNRGDSSGLSGPARGPISWFMLAAAAGLRTPALTVLSSVRRFGIPNLVPIGYRDPRDEPRSPALSSIVAQQRGWFLEQVGERRCSVYVAGDNVWGGLSPDTHQAVRRLVSSAGLSIARADFCEAPDAPGSWMFVGIDECPDLSDPDSLTLAVSYLEDLAVLEAHGTP